MPIYGLLPAINVMLKWKMFDKVDYVKVYIIILVEVHPVLGFNDIRVDLTMIVCRLEVIMLLFVYLAYGAQNRSSVTFILLTFSSWFLALSWLYAPYIFNPSGFEWQKYGHTTYSLKLFNLFQFTNEMFFASSGIDFQNEIVSRTVEDFDDWTNWLFYKGGVGVQIDNSWEAWWFDEQVSYIPSS